MTLTRTCPNCHNTHYIEVEMKDFERWQAGEHVQNVWPEKTSIEREQIMTGFCSDRCWNEYLGPEE